MNIVTNYHWRETVDASQLPAEAREEFDYIDWPAVERGDWAPRFVKYRGEWYDLSDVMLAPDDLQALGWNGFNSDSFFSGIAFRWFDSEGNYRDDAVVIARCYS